MTGPRKKKKTELNNKKHHTVSSEAWFSSQLFKIHSTGLPTNINDASKTGKKFVSAQKTEISISADGVFGESVRQRPDKTAYKLDSERAPTKTRQPRDIRYISCAFRPYL